METCQDEASICHNADGENENENHDHANYIHPIILKPNLNVPVKPWHLSASNIRRSIWETENAAINNLKKVTKEVNESVEFDLESPQKESSEPPPVVSKEYNMEFEDPTSTI